MDINLIIGGAAGQGINTIEEIILKALKKSGYFIFASKEIMSRIRGGINTTTIRISDKPKNGFKKFADILIPLNDGVDIWCRDRINENSIFLNDDKLNYSEIAKDIGGKIYENVIIAGAIAGIFSIEIELLKSIIKDIFKEKSDEILKNNFQALEKGYDKGKSLNLKNDIIKKDTSGYAMLNGTQAVGFGALGGGCNFLSFYPMSPATGVATFLARVSDELNIVVEQFEDEIAAVCSSIGAWFAGARGFVTTSGGGFALMEEGISLAGMTENPLVIHVAQRPGPATGLPTRTIQSDLNLVLNAGHGEFPRVIFAPSKIEDGFYLTQKAFNIADKYQIPVFILTDQFFVDSYYLTDKIDFTKIDNEFYVAKATKDYKRYEITPNGISLRAIPGLGEGIVLANGNEHDEYGDITEDRVLSKVMADKRMKKLEYLKKEAIMPYFNGEEDFDTLIISWGSTYYTVSEAINLVNNKKIAHLHFSQIWPINDRVKEYFNRASKIITIEGNITGQFGDLLKKEFGIKIDNKILKYNGRQFYVEEIVEKLEEI